MNHCRYTNVTCTPLHSIVTYHFNYPPHSSSLAFPFAEVELALLAQKLLAIEVHQATFICQYLLISSFLLFVVVGFFLTIFLFSFVLPKLIILGQEGQETSSKHEWFQKDTLARRCYKTTARFPFLFNKWAYHFILCPAITILRVYHHNFNFSIGLPASISIHRMSRVTCTTVLFMMQSKAVGDWAVTAFLMHKKSLFLLALYYKHLKVFIFSSSSFLSSQKEQQGLDRVCWIQVSHSSTFRLCFARSINREHISNC